MKSQEFITCHHLSPNDTNLAMSILQEHPDRCIAFSGHLGSGKDTIADTVRTMIDGDWHHEFFAEPLKDEINVAIGIIGRSVTLYAAQRDCIRTLHVSDPSSIGEKTINRIMGNSAPPIDAANAVIRRLYLDVKTGMVKSAYDRTDSTRFALQTWGTEVRRAIEPDYWVDKALSSTIGRIARGRSVVITDARFPNELDAVRELGGIVVRLTVGDAVQARRIMKRDGTVVTAAMRNHPSETALDDYGDFDLVIDTDDKTPEQIASLVVDFALHRE